MNHYFINKEHSEKDFFNFNYKFREKDFSFFSCSDVFSKNELDYGSIVLVNSILNHKEIFKGDILDVGSGYGTISILLSGQLSGCSFTLVDVNTTALKLAEKNKEINKCYNIENIIESDLFSKINRKFNHIISNPPIKTGKQLLIRLINESSEHLENLGTITFVIKKNLGADSTKKLLEKKFNNCEIWERDKGYYILHSVKKA